eukprot:CAMPEP_0117494102 /NCGR_PEP_ID=MMETSP0784-20121206/19439_1 /TAXON_ID=39447 /ORGANISM="" /LENGTH=340 /DNA_ID=CAMNT_0005288973 /DNA_START=99 /DNA_END=1117 /DNA_ORIENTATION=+
MTPVAPSVRLAPYAVASRLGRAAMLGASMCLAFRFAGGRGPQNKRDPSEVTACASLGRGWLLSKASLRGVSAPSGARERCSRRKLGGYGVALCTEGSGRGVACRGGLIAMRGVESGAVVVVVAAAAAAVAAVANGPSASGEDDAPAARVAQVPAAGKVVDAATEGPELPAELESALLEFDGDFNGPWQALGLSSGTSSTEEIRAAYRRAVRDEHPDSSTLPDAAERFQRVRSAYALLMDEGSRALLLEASECDVGRFEDLSLPDEAANVDATAGARWQPPVSALAGALFFLAVALGVGAVVQLGQDPSMRVRRVGDRTQVVAAATDTDSGSLDVAGVVVG